MDKLEVVNVSKSYYGKRILKNLNFVIHEGEFLSILGSSGCGKTTLLRILIGIESCTSGKIFKNGMDITYVDASKREMGIVFQNYALFPNMTVLENVMYALNLKIKDKEKARDESISMLKIVKMEEHLQKYPHQLSGGQQQRVAIARTLVLKPDILLFDEVMSALDADNRFILRNEIKNIQKQFHTTMIYVTHDQEEAFSMSDRVMILHDGCIEQMDIPNVIYNHPKSDYVKKFVVEHLREKVSSMESCIGIDL